MFKLLIQKIIKGYHFLISPWLGSRCRFVPTCSEYTHQAVEIHGVTKGVFLGFKRICKCHPLGKSGYDPVPAKKQHHHCKT